jgi:hypothetical protein
LTDKALLAPLSKEVDSMTIEGSEGDGDNLDAAQDVRTYGIIPLNNNKATNWFLSLNFAKGCDAILRDNRKLPRYKISFSMLLTLKLISGFEAANAPPLN